MINVIPTSIECTITQEPTNQNKIRVTMVKTLKNSFQLWSSSLKKNLNHNRFKYAMGANSSFIT